MNKTNLSRLSLIAILTALSGSALLSCDGDVPSDTSNTAGTAGSNPQGGTAGTAGTGGAAGSNPQGGSAGAAGTGGSPDCVVSPKTHEEIINACTDAEKIDKMPVLPLLNPDGSLPPLP
jgi:hypothetical protein